MALISAIIAITFVQIPAITLRYIPFSKLVTKKQKNKLLLCYIITFFLQSISLAFIMTTMGQNANPLFYKLSIILGSTIYFLINCIVIKGMLYQHIFIYGMQGSYCLLLHSFAAIILSIFFGFLPSNYQLLLQSSLFLLLFTLALFPLLHLTKDSFILNLSNEHDYYWNIIWLIPLLCFFGNTIVTMDDSWINTWRQLASRMAICTAIFIIWRCTNLDFKELQKMESLKESNKLLNIQMDAIRQQAENINYNDEKIRILRHDIRHNIQILSSLVKNNELDSANQILSELNDSLENTRSITFCKNPVINSALLVYIDKAQKAKIEIISEIDIPEHIPWSSSDIAILFANALENATNASAKQVPGKREIHINTRYADKKMGIVIKNRFDGEVLFNSKNIPISIQDGHGIGMNSIYTIVSKYNAHMNCSHENGWFSISFMFYEHFLEY